MGLAMIAKSFTVREARLSEEAPQLIAFVHGLQVYEHGFVPNRRTDALVAGEYFSELMNQIAKQDGRAFVAETNGSGELLGWAVTLAMTDAIFVREEERSYGLIDELFVTEEARGLGVGRALVSAAEADFRTRGFKILAIGVMADNARARRAYAAYGFAPYAMRLRKRI